MNPFIALLFLVVVLVCAIYIWIKNDIKDGQGFPKSRKRKL